MKLVTTTEMKTIENEANQKGNTFENMMQKAGEGVAQVVLDRFGDLENQQIIGLVGTGNNGGDTLVALTALAKEGWECQAYLAAGRPVNDPLVDKLVKAGGKVVESAKDENFSTLKSLKKKSNVLLDGLLGTGFQLPLRPEAAKILKVAGDSLGQTVVVAVDCPSGVDCANGKTADEVISADVTVCMAAVKAGLLNFPAADFAGELVVVDIGLAETLDSWKNIKRTVIDDSWVRKELPYRPRNANKGTFGTTMIIGGSVNYTGAILLAGKSAYLSGSGLVRLAVPGSIHTAIAGSLVEVTWVILPHELGVISETAVEVVFKNMEKVSCLLIGPGIGLEETTELFLKRIFDRRVKAGVKTGIGFVMVTKEAGPGVEQLLPPLVLDADALKLIAKVPEWWKMLPALTVLTPHPGEFAVMTGMTVETIQEDRLAAAEKFAREWQHIVVLKGANTVIASPDGRTAVITVASSALARAGSGDVLAGIIAGLMAQKMKPFEAAAAGVWIHAQAGLRAADWIGSEASVLASDIQNSIPEVMELVS